MDLKICRVCLDKTATISLFNSQDDIPYCAKIMRCVNVSITEGDGLPDSICDNCAAELCVSFEFSQKCEASDKALRCLDIIQTKDEYNVKEEDIKVEIDPELNAELYEQFLLDEDYDCFSEGNEKYRKKKVKEKKSALKNKDRSIQCESCGYVAVCPSALERHLRKHTGEKPYICDVCNTRFSTKGSLKKHLKIHFIVNNEETDDIPEHKKDGRKRRAKAGPMQCVVCGLMARCRSMLENHMRIHTGEKPFNCNACDMKFALKGSLKRHIETYHSKRERKYTCETCGSSFFRKNDIITHMRVHTDEKPFACSFCPKTFRQIAPLIRHKRMHTGERPYSCTICFKRFSDKSLATRHARVHSDERKFHCQLCSKSFKTRDNLNMHVKLHTNEKQHVCSYCGMAFTVKGNLQTHTRRMHSERSGQCGVCLKTFPDVAAHMRKHTGERPFVCKLCEQGFLTQRSLTHHVAYKHENNAKFKCSVGECTRSFPRANMLEFHLLKQHTQHTPYVCGHCARGFFRNSDLSRHLRVSHMDAHAQTKHVELAPQAPA